MEPRELLTTWAVESLSDTIAEDNLITLREAVMAATTDQPVGDAAAGSLHDTITFARCERFCTPRDEVLSINLDPGLGPLVVDSGSGSITIIGSTPNGSSEQLPVIGSNLTNIFQVDGSVTISGISVEGSTSQGIVTGPDSDLTIENSVLRDNGGAIFHREGTLTIRDSIIQDNATTGIGGGLFIDSNSENPATVMVIESTIERNSASGNGGGIANFGGRLSVLRSTIADNTSLSFGGGVASISLARTSIYESTVTGNDAAAEGGGVFGGASQITIGESSVANNSAGLGGGGIGFAGSVSDELTVRSTTVADNIAPVGAGINNGFGTFTVSGSTLSGNMASDSGGGIATSARNPDDLSYIINSTISRNLATNHGGGIWQDSGGLVVTNATVAINRADADGDDRGIGGGFALNSGPSVRMVNTLVAGNVRGATGEEVSELSDDVSLLSGDSINVAESLHNLIGDPFSAGGLTNDPVNVTANSNIIGLVDESGRPILDEFGRPLPWNVDRILFTELADNLGGLTAVHALKVDSPAIDAGTYFRPAGTSQPIADASNLGERLITDQRGYPFQRADRRPLNSLTSPANGASNQSTQLRFFWPTVETANTFRILVSTDESTLPTGADDPINSPAIQIDVVQTEAEFSVGAGILSEDTEYYWQYRIEESGTGEIGDWTPPRRFTTGSATLPPDPPRIIRDVDEEAFLPVDIGAYEVQQRPFFTGEELVVSTLIDESDGDHTSGDLSLREAIEIANLRSDHNSIRFSPALLEYDDLTQSPANSIYLSSPLTVQWDLTINAPFFKAPRLSGRGSNDGIENRLLEIGPMANVHLSGLRFSGGRSSQSGTKDFDVFSVDVDGGGAIFNAGNTTLENVFFFANGSNGDGGAIFNSGEMTIRDAELRNNAANGNGGMIYNAKGNMEIGPNVFMTQNIVGGFSTILGGAVYTSGDMTIIDSTIAQSRASVQGGAIYQEGPDSNLEIRRSLITDGRADGFGGGIASYGNLSIWDSTIEQSLAGGVPPAPLPGHASGGGIYARTTGGTSVLIERTTIHHNLANAQRAYGGGVRIFPGGRDEPGARDIQVINSTISNNRVFGSFEARGGGVYVDEVWDGAAPQIADSTIAFNHVDHTAAPRDNALGGGLFVDGLTELSNTIVSDNTAMRTTGVNELDDLFLGTGVVVVENVNVIPEIAGRRLRSPFNAINLYENFIDPTDSFTPPNITGDPQLEPLDLDNGGYTATHKTRGTGSAIDAGERQGLIDQRGFPTSDATPTLDLPIGDVGAYESAEQVFRVPFTTQIRGASQFGDDPAYVAGLGFDDGKPASTIPTEPGFLGLEFDPAPFQIGPGIDEDPVFGSDWGAEVTADIDGRIGIEYGYYVNSGSVDTFYEGLFNYSIDRGGDNSSLITISTAASFTDGQLFTISPQISAYADIVFELNALLSGELCAAWCADVSIPFNFAPSLQLFSINRQLREGDEAAEEFNDGDNIDEEPLFFVNDAQGNFLGFSTDSNGGANPPALNGDIQFFNQPIRTFLQEAGSLLTEEIVGDLFDIRRQRSKNQIAVVTGKNEDGSDLTEDQRRERNEAIERSVEDEKSKIKKAKGLIRGCVGELITACLDQSEDVLGAEVEIGLGLEAGLLGGGLNLGSVAVTMPDVQLSANTFDTEQGRLSATTDDFAFGSELDAKRRIAKAQIDAAALLGARFGYPLGTYNASLGPVGVEATTVSYNVGPEFSISQDVEVQPYFDDEHRATFRFTNFAGDILVNGERRQANYELSFLPGEQISIETFGKNIDIEPTLRVGNRFSNNLGLEMDVTGLLKVLELQMSFLGEEIFHVGPLFEDEHSLLDAVGIGAGDLLTIFDGTFNLNGQNDQPAELPTIEIRPDQAHVRDGKTPGNAYELVSGERFVFSQLGLPEPSPGETVYFSIPLTNEDGVVGTDVSFSSGQQASFVRPPYGGLTLERTKLREVGGQAGGTVSIELGVEGTEIDLNTESWRLRGFENLLGGAAIFGIQFRPEAGAPSILATVEGAGALSDESPIRTVTAESQRAAELQTNAFIIDNDLAFDIDNNRIISPTTDGALLARYLEGKTGSELIDGAVALDSQRRDTDQNVSHAQEIFEYLENLHRIGRLDVDGSLTNGPAGDGVDPEVDGVLILRHMAGIFGTNGAALTAGLTLPNDATRRMPDDIAAFIAGGRSIELNNLPPNLIHGRSYRSVSGVDLAQQVSADAVIGSSPWLPVLTSYNDGHGVYTLAEIGRDTQFEELYLTSTNGATRDLLRSNAIGTPGRYTDLLETLPAAERELLLDLMRDPLVSGLEQLSQRLDNETWERRLGLDAPIFVQVPYQLGDAVNANGTRVPDVAGYRFTVTQGTATRFHMDAATGGNAFFDRTLENDGTDVDFRLATLPGGQVFDVTLGVPLELPVGTQEFELFPYALTDPAVFPAGNETEPDLDLRIGLELSAQSNSTPQVTVDLYSDENRTPSSLSRILPPSLPRQIITLESSADSIEPDTTFSLDVEYQVTDNSSGRPPAVVMELHYDSSQLDFNGIDGVNLVVSGLVNSDTGIGPESVEVVSDGDLSTDRAIVLSWLDTDQISEIGEWTQHDSNTPVRLATINFRSLGTQDITAIRVTGEGSAAFEFEGAPAIIDIFRPPLVVDSASDISDGNYAPGEFSLREAIEVANGRMGPDVIEFDPSLIANGPITIAVTNGAMTITDSLEIVGLGQDQIMIDADGNSRIFLIDDGNEDVDQSVQIRDLTLSNGNANDWGGAIRIWESTTLRNLTFVDNSTRNGGAIYNQGPELNIYDSTFLDNVATRTGGAVSSNNRLYVSGSLFANNAGQGGGAIRLAPTSIATIVNSTIVNNRASRPAGGVLADGDVAIVNSTIAGNRANTGESGSPTGGGIHQRSGTLRLQNTIVAGNFRYNGELANDINGSLALDSTSNLVGTGGSGGLTDGTNGNIVGVDWKTILHNDGTALVIQDNGGPTQTVALIADSPAIDAVRSELPTEVLSDSPVAFWRLGDDPAGLAANSGSIGAVVAGTFTGTPTSTVGLIPFDATNFAIRFDGENDLVAIPDNDLLNTAVSTDQYSIELIFNAVDTQSRQVIYEQGGEGQGFVIYVESGRIVAGAWENSGNNFAAFVNTPIDANSTHHVTLVFDGTNGTLSGYLDGALFGTVSSLDIDGTISPMVSHAGDIAIAGVRDTTRVDNDLDSNTGTGTAVSFSENVYFEGTVDELSIYRKALTAADVRRHFDATQNFWPVSSDQRGEIRPQGLGVDVGAFEFTPPVVAPEISVRRNDALGQPVDSGQAVAIDFGTTVLGQGEVSETFWVTNSGGTELTLGELTVPNGFRIDDPLVASLEPGHSDVFIISALDDQTGTREGSVEFATNDLDENPFRFDVVAEVLPDPNSVVLDFVSDNGFTVTPGESLTVRAVIESSPAAVSSYQLHFDADPVLRLFDWQDLSGFGFDVDDTLDTSSGDGVVAFFDLIGSDQFPLTLGSFNIEVPNVAGTYDVQMLMDGNLQTVIVDDVGNSLPLQIPGLQVVVDDPIETIEVLSVSTNIGLPDPPDLPIGPQPSSWLQQRSVISNLAIEFSSPIASAQPTDFVLTNLGVNAPQDPDSEVALTEAQISTNGNVLTIDLSSITLPEGVYELRVLPSIDGGLDGNGDGVAGDEFVLRGSEDNAFYKLAGDWNGDRSISIFDFPTLAYWFATTGPAYVDLNRDGGISIFDFPVFATNFATNVSFGAARPVRFPPPASVESEFTPPTRLARQTRLRDDVPPDDRAHDAALLEVVMNWHLLEQRKELWRDRERVASEKKLDRLLEAPIWEPFDDLN